MKKIIAIAIVAVFVLSIGSAAYATGYGKQFAGVNVDIEKVKKFHKETISMRDELVVKNLEVRQEYSKEKPNLDHIAALKKEIIDLRTKIQKSAEANGLPAYRRGYKTARWGAKGGKKGHGIIGKGMLQGNCPRLSQ